MRPSPPLLLLVFALLTPGCVSGLTLTEREQAAAARVYRLPFEAGPARWVVQEGPGPFSHHGVERHAIDFAMPVGTKVLAARAGTVVAVKEDSDRGGRSRAYASAGNRVVIDHGDGSRAVYLHLRKNGAQVAVGDEVAAGDWIADSGNTGWSALPHLHFHVERRRTDGTWASVPVAFLDVPAGGRPKFLHAYAASHDARTEAASRRYSPRDTPRPAARSHRQASPRCGASSHGTPGLRGGNPPRPTTGRGASADTHAG